SLKVFFSARWVRESVDTLLPIVTSIGGAVVGARLLVLKGLKGGNAGASVTVDLTMEIVSQILFTLLGLGLLVFSGYHGRVVKWTVIGLGISVVMVFGFLLVQRGGLFRLVEKFFAWIAGHWSALPADTLKGLNKSIQRFYRNRWGLGRA